MNQKGNFLVEKKGFDLLTKQLSVIKLPLQNLFQKRKMQGTNLQNDKRLQYANSKSTSACATPQHCLRNQCLQYCPIAWLNCAKPGKYCFLDQLHNWGNPRAHYKTTGPEILSAFPDVSLIVGSLGSGGSLLGTAQYIKERAPQVRVVAVQAAIGSRLPGTASPE